MIFQGASGDSLSPFNLNTIIEQHNDKNANACINQGDGKFIGRLVNQFQSVLAVVVERKSEMQMCIKTCRACAGLKAKIAYYLLN